MEIPSEVRSRITFDCLHLALGYAAQIDLNQPIIAQSNGLLGG
jgi:hypothetical protein